MMNLRFATLLAAAGFSAAQAEYPDIVGFPPLTDVRDQLRIDLDQQKMEELLDLHTQEGFDAAELMYRNGSFSKTVSVLTIEDGLPVNITKGTKMTGLQLSSGGSPVTVFAYEEAFENDTSIIVQYVDEGCYVGANPDPVTDGCLAETGDLTTLDLADTQVSFPYTYVALSDTENKYSIYKFTQSSEFIFEDSALTTDFKKFVDFFGSETYADDIITAALAGTSTSFPTGKDLDMSTYDFEARAEIVAKASAYMAVWMYVLREMEHAIYLCETGDCEENSCFGKPAVHEVDEAVAFYAGSLEGTDGSGEGVLTYNLADSRAANFITAGENGDMATGTAKANLDIIAVFMQASDNIVAAECAAVREDTTRLVQLMTIPLIQGLLRYSYLSINGVDDSQKAEAERAIFAAAVLPFVAACSAGDADLIYEHTMTGMTAGNYTEVKDALERNYACLGVTEADIGGLWDDEAGDYFEGEAPDTAIAKTVDVTAETGASGGSTVTIDNSGGSVTPEATSDESGVRGVAAGAAAGITVMLASMLIV